jgi:adenylate cyclase
MRTHDVQEQMKALYTQGWRLLFTNAKEAIESFDKAYAIALECNDAVGIATYKVNMAIVYYEKGDVEKSFSLCLEALAVFEENPGNEAEQCKGYFGLGNFYWNIGIRDKGIHYYTKSYEISKAAGLAHMEARALGFLATSYYDVKEYETALTYYQEVIKVYERLNDSVSIARTKIAMGCIFRELGDLLKALDYLNSGAQISAEANYSMGLARAHNEMAKTYSILKENEKALVFYQQSLELRKKMDQKQGIISTQLDMAKFYMDNNLFDQAVTQIQEALTLAQSFDAKSKIQRAYELLYLIYEAKNDIEQAYNYFKRYHTIKNEIDLSDAEAKLNNISLSLKADQAEKETQIIKEKNQELAAINQKLEETNFALDHEKQRSEKLLLNILPESIALRLKNGEKLIADSFREVTVLFADIVGFTKLSSELTPDKLVKFLNRIFLSFDELIALHQVEKIKTIGDAYMVVSGIPNQVDRQMERMVDMALDMIEELKKISAELSHPVGVRIGIHCGPAVAGVIGSSKFSYDIWGDTVNLASRMESNGESGAINVTEAIYYALKDRYLFEDRGLIQVKGKGEIKSFFLLGKKNDEILGI